VVNAKNGGRLPGASPIGEIVLAAADIDAAEFRQTQAAVLSSACGRVTLYVSRRDKVLNVSKEINGAPRVGDCRDETTVVAGIETIDASKLPSCWLGHSYYSDSTVVTEDLKKLILDGLGATARGLEFDSRRQCWVLPKRVS
jgi:esterase/lipase superfamily enzyme